MAFLLKGIDEFESRLNELGKMSDLVDEVLIESADKVVRSMKETIETRHHYVSRDMKESIKATNPKKNKYGTFVIVRPTGKDHTGTRNMEKLAYLEYGTSRQSRKPIIKDSLKKVEKEVIHNIEERFEKEIKKAGGK